MELITKFLSRVSVDLDSGCWLWTGAKKSKKYPYGLFCVENKNVRAHRWAYEFFIGPIVSGYELDHYVCREKSCVNPYHVKPRSHSEHLEQPDSMISLKRAQTHCKRGHILAGENLLIDTNGARQCRPCRRFRERRDRLEGRRK